MITILPIIEQIYNCHASSSSNFDRIITNQFTNELAKFKKQQRNELVKFKKQQRNELVKFKKQQLVKFKELDKVKATVKKLEQESLEMKIQMEDQRKTIGAMRHVIQILLKQNLKGDDASKEEHYASREEDSEKANAKHERKRSSSFSSLETARV